MGRICFCSGQRNRGRERRRRRRRGFPQVDDGLLPRLGSGLDPVDVGQVGDGLGPDALEVHVPRLGLLLLPGHPDEGPLDVIVDHFGFSSN